MAGKRLNPGLERRVASSIWYIERVGGRSWSRALLGALALLGVASVALAQTEVEPGIEVISEPPPQLEPRAPEAAPAEVPEPAAPKPEPPQEKLGHLRVGGGIGFGFSTGYVSVAVSPQVSYLIKQIVEPGVSFRYQYSNDRFLVPSVTWHTFGGSIFTRIYPIPSLFFLVEGEIINTGWKSAGFTSDRQNYGNLLLGGGYMMGLGRGAFMGLSMKFAVFRNPFYPNAFPIISIGAGYAF